MFFWWERKCSIMEAHQKLVSVATEIQMSIDEVFNWKERKKKSNYWWLFCKCSTCVIVCLLIGKEAVHAYPHSILVVWCQGGINKHIKLDLFQTIGSKVEQNQLFAWCSIVVVWRSRSLSLWVCVCECCLSIRLILLH